MKIGKIVLIALGFIVLCLAYYCLVPKYEFSRFGGAFFRYNRITGEVQLAYPDKEDNNKQKMITYVPGRLF